MTVGRVVALVVLVIVTTACAGGDADSDVAVTQPIVGSATPELAVSAIVRAIGQGDAATLEANTLTDQLGLLALVEGASTPDAVAALGFAGEQVAETFWMSFAEQLEDFVDAGVADIRIGEISTIDVPGARYATVEVVFPLDPAERLFVVTDRGGWVVDLVATFPGAFVPNIPLAVERASSPGADPQLLESIRRQTVSLDVLEVIGVDDRMAEAVAAARLELEGGAPEG